MNIDRGQVPTYVSGRVNDTMHPLCLDWMKHVAYALVLSAHSISGTRTRPSICLTFFLLDSHSKFNDHTSDNGLVEIVIRSKMERVFGTCVLCVQLNLQRHWFSILLKWTSIFCIRELGMLIVYVCYRYCAVCHDETTSRAGWLLVRKL